MEKEKTVIMSTRIPSGVKEDFERVIKKYNSKMPKKNFNRNQLVVSFIRNFIYVNDNYRKGKWL